MKKLFIGLLALGSLSTYAADSLLPGQVTEVETGRSIKIDCIETNENNNCERVNYILVKADGEEEVVGNSFSYSGIIKGSTRVLFNDDSCFYINGNYCSTKLSKNIYLTARYTVLLPFTSITYLESYFQAHYKKARDFRKALLKARDGKVWEVKAKTFNNILEGAATPLSPRFEE